jgi:hypothetical protein
LLAPEPLKYAGKVTFGPLLQSLGLKLLVVEDPDAMARIRPRLEERSVDHAHGNRTWRSQQMKPRYRSMETHSSFGLAYYPAGARVCWEGWPKVVFGKFEPDNAPAQRIWDYYQTHRQSFGLPTTPRDDDSGELFLPAHLPDPRSTGLPPPPSVETETMPRYRAVHQQKFGNRLVSIGEEIAFLAWPPAEGLKPINEAAQRIVAYLNEHRGHPKLRAAPFCMFAMDVYLPNLPEMPRQTFARDVSEPARDVWNDEFTRQRVAEAQKTLRENVARQSREHGAGRRVGT